MGSEGTSIYLVSGANRGLGLEHVKQLLERGDTVIAGVRNPSNAPLLQPLHDHYGDNLLVVKLDVSDSASITQAAAVVAEKVPSLDVLVNNAGIALEGARISEESEDAMLSVFRTNTLGPLLTTQAFLPHLQRGRQKKIINISSGLGSIQSLKDGLKADPLPDIHRMGLSYKSSKAALNMESVALAADLKADGFKVICMCPGHVGTDMGNRGADRYGVPRPALTAETSVKGQLAIIDGLTSEQTGSYFSYTGDIIPY